VAFELGIYHFGELTPGPTTGIAPTPGRRLRELIEQVTVADEVGLDVFAVGVLSQASHGTRVFVDEAALRLAQSQRPGRAAPEVRLWVLTGHTEPD
jgi:hypothetical protein